MTDTQEVGEGAPRADSGDVVEVERADYADLEAHLANAGKTPEPLSASEPEPEKEETTDKEETVPDSKQDAAPPEEKSEDDSQTVTRAEYEKLQRRLEQKDLFIQRQAAELGEKRKALREAEEKLSRGLEDKAQLDPLAAMDDKLEIKRLQSEIKNIDAEEQAMRGELESQRYVAKHVDPSKVDMGQVLTILREDGYPEETVSAFGANPFRSASPEFIVQVSKRALERTQLMEVARIAKGLYEENKTLKTKVKDAPKEVLKSVTAAMKSAPATVTGSNGGHAATNDAFLKNPSLMSDDELNEIIARSSR